MIYVALAELVLIAFLCYGAWNALRSQQRASARERDLLLNQALHAAGRPWQPAPSDYHEPRSLYDDEGELMLSQSYARFTQNPEQEP